MGRSALHLTASSESVHARKMVSLLMRRGSTVGKSRCSLDVFGMSFACMLSKCTHTHTHTDAFDRENISPLHVASAKGHTAIIVALVEEGGADINCKGGEHGDTPLMLSVSPEAPKIASTSF